ncbi:Hypothetical predicted protein [Xyrichtys novacula]|uniref:Uncharacterized protein n=1 Tax=Xyrichtys novacula TaxID=13765 RepID=A0AAV1GYL0_XYRNO|nr:Hypothetical predicted protein [Xyrichtys novacula]
MPTRETETKGDAESSGPRSETYGLRHLKPRDRGRRKSKDRQRSGQESPERDGRTERKQYEGRDGGSLRVSKTIHRRLLSRINKQITRLLHKLSNKKIKPEDHGRPGLNQVQRYILFCTLNCKRLG